MWYNVVMVRACGGCVDCGARVAFIVPRFLSLSLSLSLSGALDLLEELLRKAASFFGFWTSAASKDLPSLWFCSGGCSTRGWV